MVPLLFIRFSQTGSLQVKSISLPTILLCLVTLLSHLSAAFDSALTLSAVTGGTCRSLIRPTDSVRCSGAIFHLFCPIPLSLCRILRLRNLHPKLPRNALCTAECKCTLSINAFNYLPNCLKKGYHKILSAVNTVFTDITDSSFNIISLKIIRYIRRLLFDSVLQHVNRFFARLYPPYFIKIVRTFVSHQHGRHSLNTDFIRTLL